MIKSAARKLVGSGAVSLLLLAGLTACDDSVAVNETAATVPAVGETASAKAEAVTKA